MGIWEILVGALVLIFSIIMIIVIILQEGHDSGLGTITGGADSFLQRGKAKTADALFAKITKYCAIAFFLLVVLLNALSYFGLTGKQKEDTKTPETSVVSEVSVVEESSTEASTTESSTEASATESSEEASATESSEEASATESSEEASATESSEEASATESSEEASATESSEETSATESSEE